ncbi:MAG: zf-HC2 domain-containing protein, partial [Verrucomicrobia bacterium]|nr:zf-HC2 domain-containing protein [Verrucomicrobiota bacterium]
MKCDEVRQVLDAYLDQEIDDAERLKIGKHLDECNDCSMLSERRREINELFQAYLGENQPPLGLETKVFAALRKKKAPISLFWILRNSWIYSSMLFILCLFLGWRLLRSDADRVIVSQA